MKCSNLPRYDVQWLLAIKQYPVMKWTSRNHPPDVLCQVNKVQWDARCYIGAGARSFTIIRWIPENASGFQPRGLTMTMNSRGLNMINHDSPWLSHFRPGSYLDFSPSGRRIDDAHVAPLVSDRRALPTAVVTPLPQEKDDKGWTRGGWGMCIRIIPHRLCWKIHWMRQTVNTSELGN